MYGCTMCHFTLEAVRTNHLPHGPLPVVSELEPSKGSQVTPVVRFLRRSSVAMARVGKVPSPSNRANKTPA